jgi:hypothetical protein
VIAFIRILKIIMAYAAASIITGFVVYTALVLFPTSGAGMDARKAGLGFGVLISAFVAYFALSPAAFVIALGAYKNWRMAWYYALPGAPIGFGLGTMFSPPDWFPWLGLGFGPIAGLVFWAIAVRNGSALSRRDQNRVAGVMLLVAIASLYWTWTGYLRNFF